MLQFLKVSARANRPISARALASVQREKVRLSKDVVVQQKQRTFWMQKRKRRAHDLLHERATEAMPADEGDKRLLTVCFFCTFLQDGKRVESLTVAHDATKTRAATKKNRLRNTIWTQLQADRHAGYDAGHKRDQ